MFQNNVQLLQCLLTHELHYQDLMQLFWSEFPMGPFIDLSKLI